MTTVMLPLGHVSWPDRDALRGDRRPVRRPRPDGPRGVLR
jgi:hypothetical protein